MNIPDDIDFASKRAYMSIQAGSLRYATFKVQYEAQIKLVKTGARDGTYNQFLEDLMEGGPNECRYGAYDFGKPDLRKLFVIWHPETVSAHDSQKYTSLAAVLCEALAYPHDVSEMLIVEARKEVDLIEENIREKL